jgi:hypothetical protein
MRSACGTTSLVLLFVLSLALAADPTTAVGSSGGALAAPSAAPTPGTWELLGPVRSGSSGRVTALTFANDPTMSLAVYATAASGGLWKEPADLSSSWRPLTDALPTLSMGSVSATSSYPYTVYIGTGDARGARNSFAGLGVFKSSDQGATWSPTSPLDPIRAPANRTAIPALLVDTVDPDTVLAAVKLFTEENATIDGGLYRTVNGGATWNRVLGGGLAGGSVVPTSLASDASDTTIIYAALGDSSGSPNNGVWKSTDHGVTFVKLGGGLPTSSLGRILLAMVPGSSQALLAAVENSATQGLLGIWKTMDGGASWQQLPAIGATCTRCKQEMVLAVSPADPAVIFFGAEKFYRSIDGGLNFSKSNAGSGGFLHDDTHAIAFHPQLPSQIWMGTDGGVTISDTSTGPDLLAWQSNDQGMSITQFYGIAVHPSNPNIAYAGAQDNGFFRYAGFTTWDTNYNNDAGPTAIDDDDPNVLYVSFGGGAGILRSDDAGVTFGVLGPGLNRSDRALFYSPFEIDPRDPNVLLLGSYRLYRTTNRADLWQAISPDLTIDPSNPNDLGLLSAMGSGGPDAGVIYTGSTNGQIYVTSNLGGSWTHVDAPPLPHRYVGSFAVHPADSSTAYVTYAGYDASSGRGHVFRTTDRGATWTDLSGNLPDLPVNHILFDPALPNIVYVGTDAGVFVSTVGGRLWRRLGSGLPNAPVLRMAIRASNLITVAAHGRGIWQIHGCAGGGVPDVDGDNVADACDNCPAAANGSQTDADLDGFGAACDCNDADPAINPGQPEIVCDGVDNNCDGSIDEGQAPPDEVASTISVSAAGSMSWSAPARANTYNLYRGDRAAGSRFSYDHSCVSAGLGVTTTTDPATPPVGRTYYYLVTSVNCMGESGLGTGSAGPRPNASPCP